MIPADVASRLQVSSDAALRPVAPTQEISDKLAGLVSGQKVMAEIQALLPNGTYRALINQRNITLALPFSAKSGDSLELQVTETDGKLAFAVLARPGADTKGAAETVSATLSKAGQLISTLYADAKGNQGKDTVLQLSTPIASAPPETSKDLLPLLKQAIQQSGMFYESHQAEWVEGRLPTNALLREPQGKLSSPEAFAASSQASAHLEGANPVAAEEPRTLSRAAADAATSATPEPAARPSASQTIAPQLQALVQQQLEALATQNFVWQGQVWPGQEMRWEIDENGSQNQQDEPTAANWSTSLRMKLPRLGEIDARLQLQGQKIAISINVGNEATRLEMQTAGGLLSEQLDAAGLTLMLLGVDALPQEKDTDET